jgi:hypothetical protein
MDVVGEPLSLASTAELDESEANDPEAVALASAPHAAEVFARCHALAGDGVDDLVVVCVVDD